MCWTLLSQVVHKKKQKNQEKTIAHAIFKDTTDEVTFYSKTKTVNRKK